MKEFLFKYSFSVPYKNYVGRRRLDYFNSFLQFPPDSIINKKGRGNYNKSCNDTPNGAK